MQTILHKVVTVLLLTYRNNAKSINHICSKHIMYYLKKQQIQHAVDWLRRNTATHHNHQSSSAIKPSDTIKPYQATMVVGL